MSSCNFRHGEHLFIRPVPGRQAAAFLLQDDRGVGAVTTTPIPEGANNEIRIPLDNKHNSKIPNRHFIASSPMWSFVHSPAVPVSREYRLTPAQWTYHCVNPPFVNPLMWIFTHSCAGDVPRGCTSCGFLLIPARSGCSTWIGTYFRGLTTRRGNLLIPARCPTRVDFCSFLRGEYVTV